MISRLQLFFVTLQCIFHASLAFNIKQEPRQASICGAGPAGLLTAICLWQKYPNCQIDVYDKRPTPLPPDTIPKDLSSFYNIGLGERGISALMEFGVWEDVQKASIHVPGRMDWMPGSDQPQTKMLTDKKYGTFVLPRDKLVSVLYEHVQQNYADRVHLYYQHDVQPVENKLNNEQVRIQVSNLCRDDHTKEPQVMESDLVVACDGAARTFVRQFELEDVACQQQDPISIVRLQDENQRVFKSLHFRLPPNWPSNLNYAVRSPKDRLIFDALPVNLKGDYVGILLFHADDEMAQPVNADTFGQFLEQEIPAFSEFIEQEEIEKACSCQASNLPMFRYVTPRLHHGENCVILGDSAKTVKPYFGLGCNSALEDVKIFGDCLDDTSSIKDAVSTFSARRAKDIEVLVTLSASLDKPGLAGIFGFIIPIILDGIFHKLAPQIFAQNVIAMLQRDDITFQQVAERKRIDRIAQIGCLSLVMAMIPMIFESLSFASSYTAAVGLR